jgi:hypothetical protein
MPRGTGRRPALGIVTGCMVLSPTEVWVLGDAHVGPGVGLWHLHGTTWTSITSLPYALADASVIGTGDIWAEGDNSFAFPVVGLQPCPGQPAAVFNVLAYGSLR